jgi:hypothetical protein
MKTITTSLLILALASCKPQSRETATPQQVDEWNEQLTATYRRVRIGKCEYLRTLGYTEGPLTHCGDCDNPHHLRAQ